MSFTIRFTELLTNTQLFALIETWAALRLAAVHGLVSSPVCRLVAHPENTNLVQWYDNKE